MVDTYTNIYEPKDCNNTDESFGCAVGNTALGYRQYELMPKYIQIGTKKLSSKVVKTHLDEGDIVTSESFGFNQEFQIKNIYVSNSDGTTTRTHHKYPQEYLAEVKGFNPNNGSLTSDSVSQAIYKLVEKNMLATPIETTNLVGKKIVGGQVVKYGYKEGLVYPKAFESLKLETPVLSTSTEFSKSKISTQGANYQYEFEMDDAYTLGFSYDEYDSYANPVQVTDHEKGIKICYLWGYNHAYPVAKIENASKKDVEKVFGNTIPDFGAAGLSDSQEATLRSSLSNAFVTTYTYAPLIGMLSQTDPNGRKTTYEYDDFGRLAFIKDHEGNIVHAYNYNFQKQ